MVVVISYPTGIADEATIMNNLFDEGLEILHIRKPGVTIDEIRWLIQKIKPQYYHRISLHQYHELARDFGIKRLHYTETNRKEMSAEVLIKLKAENYILSTSIHQVQEYNSLSTEFDYTFFGPVFNSISKPEYTAVIADDFIFPVQANHSKAIAIGGINATNILKLNEMQFNGAAVLGMIWQKPGESILQFKALQEAWKQTGQ
jgi:thiamine-phosphate pyrophosphorylase